MPGELPAARRVTGEWRRHIPAGGDPLHRPEQPADGRWQRGRDVDALYVADEPDTLWGEWYRWLAEMGLPPEMALPRDVWRFRVRLDGVADLSTRERLAAVGLDPPAPGRATWPPYQDCGQWLRKHEFTGVLAPSAGRPDHLVVCVFRDAAASLAVVPVGEPQRQEAVPTPPQGMTT